METTLVWLGRDLRILDNPALAGSASRGPIVAVFVWSPEEDGGWAPGAASRWWLHHTLESLESSLKKQGSRLIVRRGPAANALVSAARECGAAALSWNRRYEPSARAVEKRVEEGARAAGLEVRPLAGNVLFEPETVKTLAGGPYRVFTPYWNRCGDSDGPKPPVGDPGKLRAPKAWPKTEALASLNLLPKIRWDEGLAKSFTPGEDGARLELDAFLGERARNYAATRNLPGTDGNSRLSPRLAFGELSVHRIWREAGGGDPAEKGGFLGELGWRDFGRHVLHHFPKTPETPLDPRFSHFAWRRDAKGLAAWKQGLTGYPMVDAGMRELWKTGFMHNRVRMVVASFLTKDLLVDWREGARWFWDTLVDADLASNTLNWQWVAGCGADAAPFFRIFNPCEQGRRFDADGTYVRRWIPELAALPDRWLQEPASAPAEVLAQAGVVLGKTYPLPIVDHKAARLRALEVFGASGGPR